MANVGNLNATLTLSQFEFNNSLKQSETAAMEFASTVEVQSRRADKAMASVGASAGKGMSGFGRGAMVTNQIAQGVQDFQSQLGRGIGPAIMASQNNIMQLGAAFGPLGMAITAVGGVLAANLLPQLIESTGWFGQSEEAAKKYMKSLEDVTSAYRSLNQAKLSSLEGTLEQFDKGQQKRRDSMQEILGTLKIVQTRIVVEESNGNEATSKALREQEAKLIDDYNRTQKEGIALSKFRPEVQQAEAARNLEKQQKKTDEDSAKAFKQGYDEFAKIMQERIEKHGTPAEMLVAKQARELKEATEKLGAIGAENSATALNAIKAGQAVETQKLAISEEQKRLGELGPAAKGSAGVDRRTEAGVQAINRAVSGTRSEQDMAKQSLKVQQDQLKKLEEIARTAGQTKINQVSLGA